MIILTCLRLLILDIVEYSILTGTYLVPFGKDCSVQLGFAFIGIEFHNCISSNPQITIKIIKESIFNF